ncbi:type I restriction enzyme, S subunit [Nitrosomonas ureae]|uniref:Type I restriction enzyme, S subunit n=1 Tax=Nitrosomonas ureae TaxID=44577 RepID=A0A285C055_9PROT|nr:restriction endonuclease subunit S [Nitrosomonas ureae]SNX60488.1 type I restriction enzyme, S subunit [Nitrosomonas ureae]
MNAIPSLLTDHLDIWTSAETEKKSGRGRTGGNGVNVYGIQKLRELILELAVRGKLVPQDPNDEPAGELLKRIQAEKAKLVAEGKIKKDKPLPPISDEEKLFELPQEWEWTTLASISLINPRNNAEDNSSTSFVSMAMIGAKFNSSHEQETRFWKEIKQGFTHFAEGDIGVAKITPCFENSKACIFSGLLNGIGAGTTELHIVRVINKTLAPRYVLAYLKSPKFLLMGETKMTGTAGQKRLPKEFVESNPFPLPPVAEQHRIVAKVDELMALCDQLETQHINATEAHEKLVNHLLGILTQSQSAGDFNANWQRIAAHFHTLFTTEASIDALKQTLLQLTVMGKLVPQDPNDEPASELLKRIQAEKARLVAEGKIKKDRPMPPITNEEKPFELPQGWEWVRLDELGVTQTGTTPPSKDRENFGCHIPFIGPGDIKNGEIDYSGEGLSEIGLSKGRLIGKDSVLMVCIGGSIGKHAVNDRDVTCNQQINTLTPYLPVSVKYVYWAMSTISFQGAVIGQSGGSATPIINKQKWSSIPIPLPTFAEQHRIVAKIDELMTLCDQLKSAIAQASQLQKKLADGVVEQAIAS